MDSNHRRQEPADLQSAPFGHSGNHPLNYFVNIKPYRPSDFWKAVAKVEKYVRTTSKCLQINLHLTFKNIPLYYFAVLKDERENNVK